jgi:Tfp pilus assembly protein PilN
VPVFDLSLGDDYAAVGHRNPRLLIGAGAATAAIAAVGVALCAGIEARHRPVRDDLSAARQALSVVSAEEAGLRRAVTDQQELVRQIRSGNLPWTSVLGHLSRAVPDGVGLVSITAGDGRTLAITGEASGPDRVPAFWSRMTHSPFFIGADVSSITRSSDNKVSFQMSASLPAAEQAAVTGGPQASL